MNVSTLTASVDGAHVMFGKYAHSIYQLIQPESFGMYGRRNHSMTLCSWI